MGRRASRGFAQSLAAHNRVALGLLSTNQPVPHQLCLIPTVSSGQRFRRVQSVAETNEIFASLQIGLPNVKKSMTKRIHGSLQNGDEVRDGTVVRKLRTNERVLANNNAW